MSQSDLKNRHLNSKCQLSTSSFQNSTTIRHNKENHQTPPQVASAVRWSAPLFFGVKISILPMIMALKRGILWVYCILHLWKATCIFHRVEDIPTVLDSDTKMIGIISLQTTGVFINIDHPILPGLPMFFCIKSIQFTMSIHGFYGLPPGKFTAFEHCPWIDVCS